MDAPGLTMDDLYDDLRAHARGLLRSTGPLTLETTDLVHLAYLRVASGPPVREPGRLQVIARRALRSVFVDHLRHRRAAKRGSGRVRPLPANFPDTAAASTDRRQEAREMLDELRRSKPRVAAVLEARILRGLTQAQTAEHLKLSRRTVQLDESSIPGAPESAASPTTPTP